jgi:mono/diheme cytochrome c family protein
MNTIRKYKTLLILPVSLTAVLFMSSADMKEQQKPEWVAPSWADTIKNPLKGKADAVALGKKTYTTYCVACHGDKGKGDGIAAGGLNPRPANHTTDKFQKQSDGAIFWKLTSGRPPMAAYEKMLTVQQRWQLVDYMRTLKASK